MSTKLEQFLNALVPDSLHTVVILVPTEIDVRPPHPLNASVPIFVTLGNDALVRLVQLPNAPLPIFVTIGNDTLVRLVQAAKALALIVITLESDTLVRPVQP